MVWSFINKKRASKPLVGNYCQGDHTEHVKDVKDVSCMLIDFADSAPRPLWAARRATIKTTI